MIRYKCYFYLPECWNQDIVMQDRHMHAVEDNPEIPELNKHAAFINGFWLDENLMLTQENGMYWIPPSAITLLVRYDDVAEAIKLEVRKTWSECIQCPSCIYFQPGNPDIEAQGDECAVIHHNEPFTSCPGVIKMQVLEIFEDGRGCERCRYHATSKNLVTMQTDRACKLLTIEGQNPKECPHL